MQRAGEFAFATAVRRWPAAKHWQVVCGPGNNAGDGYVVAALAAKHGFQVSIVSLVDPQELTGDAATAHRDCVAAGGRVERWGGNLDASADLIIDALLGRGVLRRVDGEFAAVIAAMNWHGAPILALDIASGLHGDSGEIAGAAVAATATCAFVGLSAGLLVADGRRGSGDLYFSDLDIDMSCFANIEPAYRRLGLDERGAWLPARAHDAHKGDFGHVLVVGGGPGMPGAARICAEAALRAGAGRVSVATHASHTEAIVAGCPELMVHAIQSAEQLQSLLGQVDIVAFGPGLGRSAWAQAMYTEIAADVLPCVWDADALNFLAEQPVSRQSRIITPHPGEAARLLGVTTAEVQDNRLKALQDLQRKYAGVVVLKGAATLISSTAGAPWLNTSGNPGMAAPGMGDALTGIVAALLGQRLGQERAAVLGALLHGAAGDRAAVAGERGLMARDVIGALRQVGNP